MPKSYPGRALIHQFLLGSDPYYDDEGDLMLDFYFQIIDENDEPVSAMIGPYRDKKAVEKAARNAFRSKDY